MLALTVCMVQTFSKLLAVMGSMAGDGLLFQAFYSDNRLMQASIVSIIVAGLLTSIYAMIFDTLILLSIASLMCLITFTITNLCSLALRYRPYIMQSSPRHRTRKFPADQTSLPSNNRYGATTMNKHIKPSRDTDQNENAYPPRDSRRLDTNLLVSHMWSSEDSDTDIDDAVEDYREELRLSAFSSCSLTGSPADLSPSNITAQCAIWCIVTLTISIVILASVVTFGAGLLRDGSVILIIILCMFIVLFMVSLFILLKQPVESAILQDLAFHVRPTPFIQIGVSVANICLVLSVELIAWVMMVCWLAVGMYTK